MNDKMVQITGPFAAREDIVSDIRSRYDPDFLYIKKCGIQAKGEHMVNINGNLCEIGSRTEMLEYNNVKITSMYFLQDEPRWTTIDCILE